MSLAPKALFKQLDDNFKIPLPFREPKLPLESQVDESKSLIIVIE